MNGLQIFNSPKFGDIRTVEVNGKPHFIAIDVARALGYRNTRDAILKHCRWVVKCDVPHPQSKSASIEVNVIPEGDIYRLVANSELPAAEEFESWIFDEVIPTIRKHGIYATDAIIKQVLQDPDFGIKLLVELKTERDKRKELELLNAQKEQIIHELQPKATYYDLILQSKSVLSISKIAKDYGMTAAEMNKRLHNLGVQYKEGGVWLLYKKYAPCGYTQSKTHVIDDAKSVFHTYWTQKGRLFIYDLLKNECGILPLIERED